MESEKENITNGFENNCLDFYTMRYGMPANNVENLVPDLVKGQQSFTPRMALAAFELFNLTWTDSDCFVYAVLIFLLPPPENVIVKNVQNQSNPIYSYFGFDMKGCMPPAYHYI